jgi:hypothetical protein
MRFTLRNGFTPRNWTVCHHGSSILRCVTTVERVVHGLGFGCRVFLTLFADCAGRIVPAPFSRGPLRR